MADLPIAAVVRIAKKNKAERVGSDAAEALVKVRDQETGLWYQVLDMGGKAGNYIEASGSAMFTYAFAKGAERGFLPEKFHLIAEESFDGMLNVLVEEDPQGYPVLKDVCGAAGLGGNPYRAGDYDYYIHEKRVNNDQKGVAPFILAAIELGR